MDINEKDLKGMIVKEFVPAILTDLLLSNEISKHSSKSEVIDAVTNYINNAEKWNSINVAITIGDEFENAIENEIDLERFDVAVVLAGIHIEQALNEFYQQMLINKQKFSVSEYNSCMKSLSVRDKLTWLYKITTSDCIDDELVAKITKICSERNKIVHYKPKIESMKDWGEPINNTQKFNINELLPVIRNIKEIFEITLAFQFEKNSTAQEIYDKYFK